MCITHTLSPYPYYTLVIHAHTIKAYKCVTIYTICIFYISTHSSHIISYHDMHKHNIHVCIINIHNTITQQFRASPDHTTECHYGSYISPSGYTPDGFHCPHWGLTSHPAAIPPTGFMHNITVYVNTNPRHLHIILHSHIISYIMIFTVFMNTNPPCLPTHHTYHVK
jgi:hypothetical protein